MKTAVKIAAAAAGACAAMALGAGTASAFAAKPVPGGTSFEVNHAEAVALSQVHVAGPLLNPLYPQMTKVYYGTPGIRAGDAFQQSIDLAAAAGDRSVGMTIYGPIHSPDYLRFYHFR